MSSTRRLLPLGVLVVLLVTACGQGASATAPLAASSQPTAAQNPTGASQSGVENPAFAGASEGQPACDLEKAMDAFMQPVLAQVFGAAKLQNCGSCSPPPLTCSGYVVQRRLTANDGGPLYVALLDAGAESETEPWHNMSCSTVEMAVVVPLDGQEQKVALIVDLKVQKIWMNVY